MRSLGKVRASNLRVLPSACSHSHLGLKEYSDWPTIPQLYVGKQFVGGCDILMSMHQNGELSRMLEEKGVLVPAEVSPEAPSETPAQS